MLSKFSFATKAGTSSHLRTKANQDVYLMKTNLLELEHCHLFAVCDGHGNNGRQIATLVQKQLQVYLEQEMLNHFEGDLDYDYPSRKGIENTFNTVFQRIEEELTKMAEDMHLHNSPPLWPKNVCRQLGRLKKHPCEAGHQLLSAVGRRLYCQAADERP